MARRRRAAVKDDSAQIIRYYRELLDEPAPLPDPEFPPVVLGPTWRTDHAGRFELPEYSIGWESMAWAGQRLQLSRGVPWRFTAEQARFWLWWYAVDAHGDFIFDRQGWLQRLKGWGKDPLAAVIAANELVGPCRCDGVRRGQAHGVEEPDAWVQILAVTQRQTKNTMRIFPGLFTDEAKAEYGLQINKQQIYALGDTRYLEALTSNPDPLEGVRSTFVLGNEMQYWRSENRGHEMFAVLEGNTTKRDGARFLGIANAYTPGRDSILERTRLAMEVAQARPDEVSFEGILYDSLEAHPEAPLRDDADPDVIERIVKTVRGDAVWLRPDRVAKSVRDPKNAVSESRRKWFNQIAAAEDAWANPFAWDANGDPDLRLEPRDEIAMFFDGSKSDDATVLVACRISDGAVFPLGLWQAPPKARRADWLAPRGEVSQRVRQAFRDYRVVGFFGDPSHTREDGTLDPYWMSTIDEWHRKFNGQLLVWAKPGRDGHSIAFDMSNRHGEGARFVEAAELAVEEIEAGEFPHNAHPELTRHVKNARRFPTRHGVSLMKDGPESPRKIDLAVAAVGARMVRRQVMNIASKRGQGRGGVW